MDSNPILHQP